MPILNTLRLKNRLTQHGMPDDQAQDFVDELDDALTTAVSAQVATRADVAELRGDLKADLESTRGDLRGDIKMLQWMGGTLLALMLIVLGLVFSQQQRLATVEATLAQLKTAVETLSRPQTSRSTPKSAYR